MKTIKKLIAHATYARDTDSPQSTRFMVNVDEITRKAIEQAIQKEAEGWTGNGVLTVTGFTKAGCALSDKEQLALDDMQTFYVEF